MSREHSSVGRASALQAGGHRFEPYCSHQCGNGSVVERYLAKVNVASSNLVSRSIRKPTRNFLMERETREKPNSQSSAPEERSPEEVCRGIPPNGNKTTRRVKGGNGSISFPLNQSSRLCAYFFLGRRGRRPLRQHLIGRWAVMITFSGRLLLNM